jgi:oxaloacetate decarboxylase (Na+ extruding) subunit gamma
MSDLMLNGFNLALYGMGFVFLFLILLVFLTVIMSAVVLRFAPPTLTVAPRRRAPKRKDTGSNEAVKSADKAQIVAAITAAVRQHRQSD